MTRKPTYEDLEQRIRVLEEESIKDKQAEEALRESEDKYRNLAETANDLIVSMDFDGIITYANHAAIQLAGGMNIVGMPLKDFIPIDLVDRHNEMLQERSHGYRGTRSYEWVLNSPAQGDVPMLVDIKSSLLQDQGKPSGILFVVRDITERKRIEKALQESEQRYRHLFEKAEEGILIVRGETIEFANPALVRILGLPMDEITARPFVSFIHPEDRETVLDRHRRRMRGETVETGYDFRIVASDGDVRWLRITSRVIEWDETSASLSFLTDITDRKRAEEALKHSEANYREIFNSVNDAIYIHDMNTGQIMEINTAMLEMFGYSIEEARGLTVGDISSGDPPYTQERADELLRKVAAGEPQVFEWHCRHKSGRLFWVETSLKRAVIAGEERILAIERDITERKRAAEEREKLKEQLDRIQKLESIGTLAGGIAHDFNNLLMGIQGYASLTLLDLDPSHPHYERIKRIEEQVQSGADLTRQLLGFASGGRYEVKPTDMNDIINKTSSMFGRTKKEISIYRKSGKDLWSVEVDRGQMEQVFMNLYVNAWQAMPGGGEIYLETENVLLDDEQAFPYAVKPGKYVKIIVTDTGTGMDEKTRERIFDPFFTTKEMGRGTGLGLATVYGIIKGHKGMINVGSEPGHGTTFSIYLPASEKEVAQEKTVTGTIARGAETILLVDDEQMVLKVTRELLESLGYRVYAAGSGQEAVAVYMDKRNDIDLVILDMIMPGISGGETFDRLREINPEIRVLLSSGYSLDGEAQTIMERGCNGFLQKPFQLENLSRKVREVLGGYAKIS